MIFTNLLRFLQMLLFPRALQKLQNGVNLRFFYLKLFCVLIINASIILFSKHGKIKRSKRRVI